MTLNELSIVEAGKKLSGNEISSVDITKACLDRIRQVDGRVKACLSVCEDEAMLAAEAADLRRRQGEDNDLLGIPYIAKDNILTKGVKTTAASRILENYVAPYDATVIERLKAAGAVLLGKANLDEFAHGASTENSAFGPTHNPWDLTRVPGGSSGGSAAAVAADLCLFALGTDTGGSIRHPASFCSVSGLKPSYGRASRFGLIAMTSSTDVPGPLAKSAEDAAIVLSAIAGHDRRDATTPEVEVPVYRENIKTDIKGMKIGLPAKYFDSGLDQEIKQVVLQAVEKYKELGAEVVDIDLPHPKYGVAVYYIITPSEISSNLARFDGIRYGLSEQQGRELVEIYQKTRGQGFGSEPKRRIMLGTYALSAGYFDAYYLKAQKVRTVIREEFDRVLEDVDCIITPTTSSTAFKIGEQADDPLQMYLEDVFVTGASLSGLPALSIPAGFARGLPAGLQLIGSRFSEQAIFDLAHAYQSATDYHRQKPNI